MDSVDPGMQARGPRINGQPSSVECSFAAKQYPPTTEQIGQGDTDHWYVMVEPQGARGTPLANVTIALRLRDDSYENATRVAQILDRQVKSIDLTALTRPGAGSN